MPDAARYHRLRLVLAAAGLALSIAFLAVLVLTGAAHALARAAAHATGSVWGQVALVAVVLGAARAVLTFPLGWTRGWWLPRRYGLLHQSLQGWLADRAKATLLSGAASASRRSACGSPTSHERAAPRTPRSSGSAARGASCSSTRSPRGSRPRRSSPCWRTSWATTSTATRVAASPCRAR